MATPKQQNYLEVLFGDLGFSRIARNEFLSREVGRTISYLDELSTAEASAMINALVERKEDRKLKEQILKEEQEF